MLLLRTDKGETVAELERERTAIGRDAANDVVLEDASVSGFHAVVLNDRGTVSIVDLGSTNGTVMDGVRLRKRTELKAWSVLQLGGVKLEVTDTEGRRPTRVQPIVSAGGQEHQATVAAQRTRVRPAEKAEKGDTRMVSQPQSADAIRFESLEQPPAVPEVSVSPPPSPNPVAVQDSGGQATTDASYALFGGYPRGLAWLLFSFKGRVRRSLWWKCLGISLVVVGIPNFVTAMVLFGLGFGQHSYLISSFLFGLLTIWPWMAINAKRIHDSGRSALPWCSLFVLAWVLANVSNWLQADRAPQGEQTLFGWLVLLVSIPALYGVYLVMVKAGDEGENGFGDQNPRTGIVLGGKGRM